MNRVLLALSAALMAASPATAAPAVPSTIRAGADADDASALAGGGGLLVALAAAGAIIVALIVVNDDEAEDAPTSP